MKFGLEHEIALAGSDGWLDYTNIGAAVLTAMIDALPSYEADYPNLRVGNVGIKVKRWYIEGLERFDDDGGFVGIVPKGLEIRTPICDSVAATVDQLWSDRQQLSTILAARGWRPIETSFNPYQTSFVPSPPLNERETADTEMTEVETAGIYMLTYGPDINLSSDQFDDARLIDLSRKLTDYSPYLAVFSLNAPFYGGKLWPGYSARTYYRTGPRPAATAYVAEIGDAPPAIAHTARIPAERGRLEFKAFDTATSPAEYRALIALVKGVVLDATLEARADVPDQTAHRHVATVGFDDDAVHRLAGTILSAAERALEGDPDREHLSLLRERWQQRRTPAHDVIERYNETHDIMTALEVYDDR